MDKKPFKSIEEQVELLQSRGVKVDSTTAGILMREGYYSVVNGYKGPFIDEERTKEAGEDRYRPGTSFDDIYGVFAFDRDLRELTFHYLLRISGLRVRFLSPAPRISAGQIGFLACISFFLKLIRLFAFFKKSGEKRGRIGRFCTHFAHAKRRKHLVAEPVKPWANTVSSCLRRPCYAKRRPALRVKQENGAHVLRG